MRKPTGNDPWALSFEVVDLTPLPVPRLRGPFQPWSDDRPWWRPSSWWFPARPLIVRGPNPLHVAMQRIEAHVPPAEPSTDGMVYVCDRPNDRIQVFTKDGKFVKETQVAKNTRGDGSVWDIAFSKDAEQKYFYLADGANEKIRVFDRKALTELTSFGDGGRQPGQFYAPHSVAVDSKGNLYTTETYEGKRVQKFVYKGMRPVSVKDQGVVWPR